MASSARAAAPLPDRSTSPMAPPPPPPAKRARAAGSGAAASLSVSAPRPPSASQRALAAAVTGLPAAAATAEPPATPPPPPSRQHHLSDAPSPPASPNPSATSVLEEQEDSVPDVMRNVFTSASLSELRAAIERAGRSAEPSPTNDTLRPYMNFSILVRAPAMLSKVFEMVSAVLNRSGGRESKGSIGFTVVMLNAVPHLAVDVGDETYTFVVSVRISTEVHVHPAFEGFGGKFPVFRVSCKSMVDKLNQVKDFKRVMIYQQRDAEDRLEIMIDMPHRPGDVQIETVKIQADEWSSLHFEDVTHEYTLQMSIKAITHLCKMQQNASGSLTLSIFQRPEEAAIAPGGGRPAAAFASPSGDREAVRSQRDLGSAATPSSAAPSRRAQSYILKLEVVNAMGEHSSTLRPIVNEVETTVDPATGEVLTTMHFSEGAPLSGLDLLENLVGCTRVFSQSFASGQIEAFLSKWDPNKMITMRLAEGQPMVMSYNYGSLVICQMVAAPQVESDS